MPMLTCTATRGTRAASVIKLGMVVIVVGISSCGEEFSMVQEQEPEAADGCEPGEASRPWWDGEAQYRQQLVVRNASTLVLGQDATVVLDLDTAALVEEKKLTPNCRDLHVVHQASGASEQLPRMHAPAGLDCADSSSTRVFFRLAADLEPGFESTDYFLYYGNPGADLVPAPTEGVFDVADGKAKLVCPLDASVDCLVGPQPSETRGLRFSASNTAADFSGVSGSRLKVDWKSAPLAEGTYELIFRLHDPLPSVDQALLGLGATTGASEAAGLFALDFEPVSGRLRLKVHDGKALATFHSAQSTWDAGVWMHLALAWSEGSLRLYVDGALDSSWPWSAPLFASSSQLYLGETQEGPWRGALDEVRVSSVARYGKAFTPSRRAFVPDANTELLLHFDEDGADPRLPGVAVDSSPRRHHATASGVTYVPGPEGFGQSHARHGGLIVENETVNRVLNPSFENELNPSFGWELHGTLEVQKEGEAAFVRFGKQSAGLKSTGVARFTTSIAGESEGPAAFCAYVRNRDGRPLREEQVRLVWAGNAVNKETGARYEYAGGGWWRLWYQGAREVAASPYGVELTDADVLVDGVQWERWEEASSWEHRGWPSTYADGSLGDAYGWDGNCDGTADSGAEHESCSVRLGIDGADEGHVVVFENQGDLVAVTGGTVSLWFRPLWAHDVESRGWSRSLLQAGYGAGHGPGFNFHVTEDVLRLYVFDELPNRSVGVEGMFPPGGWAHAVGSWNGEQGRVFANMKGATSAFAFDRAPEHLHLGGGAGWTRGADAVLADLRLFDKYLTDAQIEQVHHAGLVGFGRRCEEALPK